MIHAKVSFITFLEDKLISISHDQWSILNFTLMI